MTLEQMNWLADYLWQSPDMLELAKEQSDAEVKKGEDRPHVYADGYDVPGLVCRPFFGCGFYDKDKETLYWDFIKKLIISLPVKMDYTKPGSRGGAYVTASDLNYILGLGQLYGKQKLIGWRNATKYPVGDWLEFYGRDKTKLRADETEPRLWYKRGSYKFSEAPIGRWIFTEDAYYAQKRSILYRNLPALEARFVECSGSKDSKTVPMTNIKVEGRYNGEVANLRTENDVSALQILGSFSLDYSMLVMFHPREEIKNVNVLLSKSNNLLASENYRDSSICVISNKTYAINRKDYGLPNVEAWVNNPDGTGAYQTTTTKDIPFSQPTVSFPLAKGTYYLYAELLDGKPKNKTFFYNMIPSIRYMRAIEFCSF